MKRKRLVESHQLQVLLATLACIGLVSAVTPSTALAQEGDIPEEVELDGPGDELDSQGSDTLEWAPPVEEGRYDLVPAEGENYGKVGELDEDEETELRRPGGGSPPKRVFEQWKNNRSQYGELELIPKPEEEGDQDGSVPSTNDRYAQLSLIPKPDYQPLPNEALVAHLENPETASVPARINILGEGLAFGYEAAPEDPGASLPPWGGVADPNERVSMDYQSLPDAAKDALETYLRAQGNNLYAPGPVAGEGNYQALPQAAKEALDAFLEKQRNDQYAPGPIVDDPYQALPQAAKEALDAFLKEQRSDRNAPGPVVEGEGQYHALSQAEKEAFDVFLRSQGNSRDGLTLSADLRDYQARAEQRLRSLLQKFCNR